MVIYISRSGETPAARHLRQENPGVAKFGIALEWGSRGPEFESQHSDQSRRQLQKQLPFVFAFSSQMSTALRTGKVVLSLYVHFMTRVSKYRFFTVYRPF